MPVIAYIGLGSNLGDRRATIERALNAFRRDCRIEVIRVSEMLETEPEGPPGQGRYLNATASLRTTLEPRELLNAMLAIERDLGRDRANHERNGPRTIDLDLLLHGERIIEEPGLTVPHPRMQDRDFVLRPLRMIAADVVHPRLGMTVVELHERLAARARIVSRDVAHCRAETTASRLVP
jgi:2-amino-4-hydroxy-6-hydroxymethyldihydropteridine diphosphokinase